MSRKTKYYSEVCRDIILHQKAILWWWYQYFWVDVSSGTNKRSMEPVILLLSSLHEAPRILAKRRQIYAVHEANIFIACPRVTFVQLNGSMRNLWLAICWQKRYCSKERQFDLISITLVATWKLPPLGSRSSMTLVGINTWFDLSFVTSSKGQNLLTVWYQFTSNINQQQKIWSWCILCIHACSFLPNTLEKKGQPKLYKRHPVSLCYKFPTRTNNYSQNIEPFRFTKS